MKIYLIDYELIRLSVLYKQLSHTQRFKEMFVLTVSLQPSDTLGQISIFNVLMHLTSRFLPLAVFLLFIIISKTIQHYTINMVLHGTAPTDATKANKDLSVSLSSQPHSIEKVQL